MFGIGAILNFIMQLSFKPFGTAFFAFFLKVALSSLHGMDPQSVKDAMVCNVFVFMYRC